jgi:hypothetical protein
MQAAEMPSFDSRQECYNAGDTGSALTNTNHIY